MANKNAPVVSSSAVIPPVIIVFESPRLYLTIEEAAQYLRVSRRTLYILMKNKQVTFARVRNGIRFRLQHLNEYFDKRTVKAA
jgi:excisionase family DNA binding protein